MIKDIDINNEMLFRANKDIAKRSGTGTYIYLFLWLVIMILHKFYETAPKTCLWLTITFIVLALVRILLVYNFEGIYSRNPLLWKLLFFTAVWMAALTWGILCAFALVDQVFSPLSLPVVISTAGLVGGGATSFSPSRILTAGIIVSYLFPAEIVLLVTGVQHSSVSIIFIIYAVAMYLISMTHHSQYWLGLKYSSLIQKQAAELKELNTLDGLTGIKNRAFFDQTLRREMKSAIRKESNLALLFIDIDHFKNINDKHGHLAGDECLRRLSILLREKAKRETDTVARYGGEEFAVILPYTGIKEAVQLAEIIRKGVMEIDLRFGESKVAFTVSIGVTATRPKLGESGETLVESADNALYEAKNNGRNQVRALPVKNV